MNRARIDKIAQALLYEGYVLYPYRPSVKNSQRWTFGCVHPRAWNEADNPTDAFLMRTQCLVTGDAPVIAVSVRFLHLLDRAVGKLASPIAEWPIDREPPIEEVDSLDLDDRHLGAWQEAVEREVDLGEMEVAQLSCQPVIRAFSFERSRNLEPVASTDGSFGAVLIRELQTILGTITVASRKLADRLYHLTIEIDNTTSLSPENGRTRDDALMRSLVSTHTILGVRDGEFISLTDPPETLRNEAAACKNIGTWPVLIGTGDEHDTMLSSPIILSDYPELAPESPGDLFDSTEIDEILTLRIMTLTDEEKRAAAGTDERVKALLERTQSLAREQLMNLHGTVRGLRPVRTDHG